MAPEQRKKITQRKILDSNLKIDVIDSGLFNIEKL